MLEGPVTGQLAGGGAELAPAHLHSAGARTVGEKVKP